MLSLIHYAELPIIGVVVGLIALAYRDILRRISHCEKVDEKLIPQIIEIGVNVKHIRAHCANCQEII